jgi:DNA-binding NtrC family response regulator
MLPTRILVADDNQEMAQSVADGLSERGYDVAAVGSGREALDLLSSQVFDAVVTDLRMPEIDGLALIARSRMLDPDRPIIVMTAYSAVDVALESLRQGAYQYVTKPFKQEELAILLERALDQARVKRGARTLESVLRRYATRAVQDSGGQLARAAEMLGVDTDTLQDWLQRPV